MKVIIPLAGKGTRLRPHTHLTPKPMLKVAGKPVMAYILEDLEKLGNVEQIIYITGHLKEKVEEYVRAEFDFPSVFIEQKVQDGTAGHFLHACGAGTGQPEGPGRIEALVTCLVPLYEESRVRAIDGVWSHWPVADGNVFMGIWADHEILKSLGHPLSAIR